MGLPPPMLDTSDDAVVRAIVEHDVFLISTLARGAGAELHEEPDATWYLSGVPESLFNGVIRAAFAEADADRRVDELLGRFRDAEVPSTWWVGPLTAPPGLSARLEERGFQRTEFPGMSFDLGWLVDASPPEGVRVEVVGDEAGLDAWMRANGDGFGIPLDERDRYRPTPEAVLTGELPGWCVTAWADDLPVATAMVCVATGVAGVSNVATAPTHRRRGLGAIATTYALGLARDGGYRTAVLTSTQSGRPLYERLGFRLRCTVDVCTFTPGP
jgi:GNAT superfamily N-acetyltransferase